MTELEPCPFCKEEENIHITLLPTVSYGKSVSPEDSWKAMKCQLCGATGPMSKDPEEARKLWSTRTPAPAEVERMVEEYASLRIAQHSHFSKGLYEMAGVYESKADDTKSRLLAALTSGDVSVPVEELEAGRYRMMIPVEISTTGGLLLDRRDGLHGYSLEDYPNARFFKGW